MTPGALAKGDRACPAAPPPSPLGVGVLGLASFGYLVVAGRALGPERFGTVAIYWVVLNTLGAGLFLPLEQHVSRDLAAGARSRGRRAPGPAAGRQHRHGGAGAADVVAWLARDPVADAFFGGSTPLVVALVAGTAADGGVLHVPRRLRGARVVAALRDAPGDRRPGPVRRRLPARAVRAPTPRSRTPRSSSSGWSPRRSPPCPGAPSPAAGGRPPRGATSGRTLGWLLVASVSGLALLNAAPARRRAAGDGAGTAATVGNFVAALTLARIPLFLFSAVQASLLPALSRHVGAGRPQRFAPPCAA
jgi:hypothetical protein